MSATGIGAPVRRKEDQRFITGLGHYTDDLTRPGQTHAVFVRSPHAHARIKRIDSAEAARMPGVVGILTGKELAADKLGGLICGWMIHSKDGSPMKAGPHPALALDTVRYVGDHVAVVIAETYAQAKDAAEKVDVDYDILPAVTDGAAALRPGAPQIHAEVPGNLVYDWVLGEKAPTESAFKSAAHVTRLTLINNRLIPNAMEPRAAIGEYDAGSGITTLWTTSQNPHVARLVLSAFVQLAPEHKLRVIAPDVGGGFGSKIFIYAEETVAAWASRKVGRPVKWTAERSESFLSDAHGRDHHTHAELAMAKDGKFLALRVKTIANMGAYLSTFASSVPTYLYATLLSGQYAIPAIHAEVQAVFTNTSPVDAYRGAGRPEATFVVERLVEEAAREMKVDPAELRRRNFVRTFPHQTPVVLTYDAGDYEASLAKALTAIDYKGFPARKAEAKARGKLRGIGFSTYIEACGLAPSAAAGSLGAGVGLWESAEVRVNPTGSVEVLTGAHSHGQGHETTFAQIVSERLGIPIENVEIVHGDTDKVQFGMGTYGSRTSVGMSAIVKALDKVEAKAKKIASHLLEASADDIVLKDGKFTVAGTDRSITFPEVALAAYVAHKFPTAEIEPGLKETSFYDPLNFTFPAGSHICELEIDPDTGVTKIVRFVAVDDFGNVINPMIVEGQVHGGVTQGIGQALLEHGVYDKDSGQLITGSYMDYCMPRADDLPSFELGFTVTPCPSNPLGVKGCGEAGAIAAPAAVMNAVTDALGHSRIDMPATPSACGAQSIRTLKGAADATGAAGNQETTMYQFNYHRPKSLDEAAKLFSGAGEPRFLAGGQTLLPTMKQRLNAPTDVIDLSGVSGLAGISRDGNAISIGAMTRHADVATSAEIKKAIPALAHLAEGIGDPLVRHMGTIGGSLANNDPAADYPAAVLGLGATIHTTKRQIAADAFFKGMFETALEPGEIITKIVFPLAERAGYVKFANPASRYAMVGVFAAKTAGGVRLAVTGAGPVVFRVPAMEAALTKSFTPDAVAAIAVPAGGLNSDLHGSAEYRAHLVTVMAKRAVAAALS